MSPKLLYVSACVPATPHIWGHHSTRIAWRQAQAIDILDVDAKFTLSRWLGLPLAAFALDSCRDFCVLQYDAAESGIFRDDVAPSPPRKSVAALGCKVRAT